MISQMIKSNRILLYPIFIWLWFFISSCSTIDYFKIEKPAHGSYHFKIDNFNLITYNIKAIYKKEDDEITNLMDYVNNNNFDFVIFQELFNESTRDAIIEKADYNNFTTFIARVDYNSFPELIFQDAGLFMMSRYPRIDLSEIEFADGIKNSNGVIHKILEKEISKTNDFLANKSVLGALFDIDGSAKLFLFTTHVQAIGSTEIKERQLAQIKEFIDDAVDAVIKSGTVKLPENLIVVLAGDFNSNAYDVNRFAAMQNLLGQPRDLHKEFHGLNEEYTFRFSSRNASRRFDYVLAYDSLMNYNFKKVNAESINAVDIKNDSGESISDHLGLKATIKFN